MATQARILEARRAILANRATYQSVTAAGFTQDEIRLAFEGSIESGVSPMPIKDLASLYFDSSPSGFGFSVPNDRTVPADVKQVVANTMQAQIKKDIEAAADPASMASLFAEGGMLRSYASSAAARKWLIENLSQADLIKVRNLTADLTFSPSQWGTANDPNFNLLRTGLQQEVVRRVQEQIRTTSVSVEDLTRAGFTAEDIKAGREAYISAASNFNTSTPAATVLQNRREIITRSIAAGASGENIKALVDSLPYNIASDDARADLMNAARAQLLSRVLATNPKDSAALEAAATAAGFTQAGLGTLATDALQAINRLPIADAVKLRELAPAGSQIRTQADVRVREAIGTQLFQANAGGQTTEAVIAAARQAGATEADIAGGRTSFMSQIKGWVENASTTTSQLHAALPQHITRALQAGASGQDIRALADSIQGNKKADAERIALNAARAALIQQVINASDTNKDNLIARLQAAGFTDAGLGGVGRLTADNLQGLSAAEAMKLRELIGQNTSQEATNLRNVLTQHIVDGIEERLSASLNIQQISEVLNDAALSDGDKEAAKKQLTASLDQNIKSTIEPYANTTWDESSSFQALQALNALQARVSLARTMPGVDDASIAAQQAAISAAHESIMLANHGALKGSPLTSEERERAVRAAQASRDAIEKTVKDGGTIGDAELVGAQAENEFLAAERAIKLKAAKTADETRAILADPIINDEIRAAARDKAIAALPPSDDNQVYQALVEQRDALKALKEAPNEQAAIEAARRAQAAGVVPSEVEAAIPRIYRNDVNKAREEVTAETVAKLEKAKDAAEARTILADTALNDAQRAAARDKAIAALPPSDDNQVYQALVEQRDALKALKEAPNEQAAIEAARRALAAGIVPSEVTGAIPAAHKDAVETALKPADTPKDVVAETAAARNIQRVSDYLESANSAVAAARVQELKAQGITDAEIAAGRANYLERVSTWAAENPTRTNAGRLGFAAEKAIAAGASGEQINQWVSSLPPAIQQAHTQAIKDAARTALISRVLADPLTNAGNLKQQLSAAGLNAETLGELTDRAIAQLPVADAVKLRDLIPANGVDAALHTAANARVRDGIADSIWNGDANTTITAARAAGATDADIAAGRSQYIENVKKQDYWKATDPARISYNNVRDLQITAERLVAAGASPAEVRAFVDSFPDALKPKAEQVLDAARAQVLSEVLQSDKITDYGTLVKALQERGFDSNGYGTLAEVGVNAVNGLPLSEALSLRNILDPSATGLQANLRAAATTRVVDTLAERLEDSRTVAEVETAFSTPGVTTDDQKAAKDKVFAGIKDGITQASAAVANATGAQAKLNALESLQARLTHAQTLLGADEAFVREQQAAISAAHDAATLAYHVERKGAPLTTEEQDRATRAAQANRTAIEAAVREGKSERDAKVAGVQAERAVLVAERAAKLEAAQTADEARAILADPIIDNVARAAARERALDVLNPGDGEGTPVYQALAEQRKALADLKAADTPEKAIEAARRAQAAGIVPSEVTGAIPAAHKDAVETALKPKAETPLATNPVDKLADDLATAPNPEAVGRILQASNLPAADIAKARDEAIRKIDGQGAEGVHPARGALVAQRDALAQARDAIKKPVEGGGQLTDPKAFSAAAQAALRAGASEREVEALVREFSPLARKGLERVVQAETEAGTTHPLAAVLERTRPVMAASPPMRATEAMAALPEKVGEQTLVQAIQHEQQTADLVYNPGLTVEEAAKLAEAAKTDPAARRELALHLERAAERARVEARNLSADVPVDAVAVAEKEKQAEAREKAAAEQLAEAVKGGDQQAKVEQLRREALGIPVASNRPVADILAELRANGGNVAGTFRAEGDIARATAEALEAKEKGENLTPQQQALITSAGTATANDLRVRAAGEYLKEVQQHSGPSADVALTRLRDLTVLDYGDPAIRNGIVGQYAEAAQARVAALVKQVDELKPDNLAAYRASVDQTLRSLDHSVTLLDEDNSELQNKDQHLAALRHARLDMVDAALKATQAKAPAVQTPEQAAMEKELKERGIGYATAEATRLMGRDDFNHETTDRDGFVDRRRELETVHARLQQAQHRYGATPDALAGANTELEAHNADLDEAALRLAQEKKGPEPLTGAEREKETQVAAARREAVAAAIKEGKTVEQALAAAEAKETELRGAGMVAAPPVRDTAEKTALQQAIEKHNAAPSPETAAAVVAEAGKDKALVEAIGDKMAAQTWGPIEKHLADARNFPLIAEAARRADPQTSVTRALAMYGAVGVSIGQTAVGLGLVTPGDIAKAMAAQKAEGPHKDKLLGDILVAQGAIPAGTQHTLESVNAGARLRFTSTPFAANVDIKLEADLFQRTAADAKKAMAAEGAPAHVKAATEAALNARAFEIAVAAGGEKLKDAKFKYGNEELTAAQVRERSTALSRGILEQAERELSEAAGRASGPARDRLLAAAARVKAEAAAITVPAGVTVPSTPAAIAEEAAKLKAASESAIAQAAAADPSKAADLTRVAGAAGLKKPEGVAAPTPERDRERDPAPRPLPPAPPVTGGDPDRTPAAIPPVKLEKIDPISTGSGSAPARPTPPTPAATTPSKLGDVAALVVKPGRGHVIGARTNANTPVAGAWNQTLSAFNQAHPEPIKVETRGRRGATTHKDIHAAPTTGNQHTPDQTRREQQWMKKNGLYTANVDGVVGIRSVAGSIIAQNLKPPFKDLSEAEKQVAMRVRDGLVAMAEKAKRGDRAAQQQFAQLAADPAKFQAWVATLRPPIAPAMAEALFKQAAAAAPAPTPAVETAGLPTELHAPITAINEKLKAYETARSALTDGTARTQAERTAIAQTLIDAQNTIDAQRARIPATPPALRDQFEQAVKAQEAAIQQRLQAVAPDVARAMQASRAATQETTKALVAAQAAFEANPQRLDVALQQTALASQHAVAAYQQRVVAGLHDMGVHGAHRDVLDGPAPDRNGGLAARYTSTKLAEAFVKAKQGGFTGDFRDFAASPAGQQIAAREGQYIQGVRAALQDSAAALVEKHKAGTPPLSVADAARVVAANADKVRAEYDRVFNATIATPGKTPEEARAAATTAASTLAAGLPVTAAATVTAPEARPVPDAAAGVTPGADIRRARADLVALANQNEGLARNTITNTSTPEHIENVRRAAAASVIARTASGYLSTPVNVPVPIVPTTYSTTNLATLDANQLYVRARLSEAHANASPATRGSLAEFERSPAGRDAVTRAQTEVRAINEEYIRAYTAALPADRAPTDAEKIKAADTARAAADKFAGDAVALKAATDKLIGAAAPASGMAAENANDAGLVGLTDMEKPDTIAQIASVYERMASEALRAGNAPLAQQFAQEAAVRTAEAFKEYGSLANTNALAAVARSEMLLGGFIDKDGKPNTITVQDNKLLGFSTDPVAAFAELGKARQALASRPQPMGTNQAIERAERKIAEAASNMPIEQLQEQFGKLLAASTTTGVERASLLDRIGDVHRDAVIALSAEEPKNQAAIDAHKAAATARWAESFATARALADKDPQAALLAANMLSTGSVKADGTTLGTYPTDEKGKPAITSRLLHPALEYIAKAEAQAASMPAGDARRDLERSIQASRETLYDQAISGVARDKSAEAEKAVQALDAAVRAPAAGQTPQARAAAIAAAAEKLRAFQGVDPSLVPALLSQAPADVRAELGKVDAMKADVEAAGRLTPISLPAAVRAEGAAPTPAATVAAGDPKTAALTAIGETINAAGADKKVNPEALAESVVAARAAGVPDADIKQMVSTIRPEQLDRAALEAQMKAWEQTQGGDQQHPLRAALPPERAAATSPAEGVGEPRRAAAPAAGAREPADAGGGAERTQPGPIAPVAHRGDAAWRASEAAFQQASEVARRSGQDTAGMSAVMHKMTESAVGALLAAKDGHPQAKEVVGGRLEMLQAGLSALYLKSRGIDPTKATPQQIAEASEAAGRVVGNLEQEIKSTIGLQPDGLKRIIDQTVASMVPGRAGVGGVSTETGAPGDGLLTHTVQRGSIAPGPHAVTHPVDRGFGAGMDRRTAEFLAQARGVSVEQVLAEQAKAAEGGDRGTGTGDAVLTNASLGDLPPPTQRDPDDVAKKKEEKDKDEGQQV